jgi:hypothetical protein
MFLERGTNVFTASSHGKMTSPPLLSPELTGKKKIVLHAPFHSACEI